MNLNMHARKQIPPQKRCCSLEESKQTLKDLFLYSLMYQYYLDLRKKKKKRKGVGKKIYKVRNCAKHCARGASK